MPLLLLLTLALVALGVDLHDGRRIATAKPLAPRLGRSLADGGLLGAALGCPRSPARRHRLRRSGGRSGGAVGPRRAAGARGARGGARSPGEGHPARSVRRHRPRPGGARVGVEPRGDRSLPATSARKLSARRSSTWSCRPNAGPESRTRWADRSEFLQPLRSRRDYVRRDGQRIICDWYSTPRLNDAGELHGVRSVASDVTEEVNAAETLRRDEQRLRELTENMSEVSWLSEGGTHRLLFVSKAYESVWGRSCDSLYEDPLSWLEAVHPDDRVRVEREFAAQSSGRMQLEFRIVRSSDEVRWIARARPSRSRTRTDTSYRMAGICEDITERRRWDEERRTIEDPAAAHAEAREPRHPGGGDRPRLQQLARRRARQHAARADGVAGKTVRSARTWSRSRTRRIARPSCRTRCSRTRERAATSSRSIKSASWSSS